VFIDGSNIVPGGLVIGAGQEVDLERSLANNNLNAGNKLKFIERTGAVEAHRGIKLEDGIVRIEYQFEKVYRRQDGVKWNQIDEPFNGAYGPLMGSAGPGTRPMFNINGVMRGVDYSQGETVRVKAASATTATLQSMNISTASLGHYKGQATMDSYAANETGITVPGSKSEQKFSTASWFATESEKHVLIFRLAGETEDNRAIREPVTVKTKPRCVTCGRQNKATANFCAECGTSLKIVA
jgi:hypothetical protein